MRAFTNVTVTKTEFLKELRRHQKADAFLRGTYQEAATNAVGFRGCAVGCSLHSVARFKDVALNYADHKSYETHLGIPEWLARVEDRLFEGMGAECAETWPVDFAKAIPEGANLETVKGPFLVIILRRVLTKFNHDKFPDVKAAVERSIACWENPNTTEEEFRQARAEAEAEAEAAARAAEAAAWGRAAEAAAWAAWAAWAAAWAEAAWAAARAAEAEYEYFADELLKLLRKCK